MRKMLFAITVALCTLSSLSAQERLTREQILAMSTEELSELPLEDLMQAVETLGVSSVDELFALIMNKNVSSASKKEEDSFVSPLSSTVLTRDEMRTYGVSTIEEAFRLIPGMIVSEKTNGVYDVQVRGLYNIPDNNMILYTENANILVMVDGRITHNYATGMPNFETLPISIEDVERIEVVRGATSALYGPNAVNGVVNIITTRPDMAASIVSGSAQYGNNTTVADLAIRKNFNNTVAAGISVNGQIRKRESNRIPFIPQAGYYVVSDLANIQNGQHLTYEEIDELLARGCITDISTGADLSVKEITQMMKSSADETGRTFTSNSSVESQTLLQWEDAYRARDSYGVNGYLSIKPSEHFRIDLTGGYQNSKIQTTSIGNEDVAFRSRTSSTGYANINVNAFGLRLLANYSDGVQDFAQGSTGFKMQQTQNINVLAEYDINIGGLQIRPGLSWQRVHFKDADPRYFDYGDGRGPQELSGYFGYYSQGNNSAELTDFAPSLRLDFKVDDLRLIAAVRTDKTNLPDKWNPSWQFAASYRINNDNFVRAVYGRSFRSASIANTSSNYNWMRTGTGVPEQIQFLGNEETPLVHIDNFEIGYRCHPTQKLLLDAEAFLSFSTDYGELKAYESMLTMRGDELSTALGSIMSGATDPSALGSLLPQLLHTKTYIRYGDVPFKVRQMGVSLNLDWIISPKLIAKFNANIQQTTIDNYYQYSQATMIAKQLMQSQATTLSNLPSLVSEVLTGATIAAMSGGSAQTYIQDCLGYTPVQQANMAYSAMSDAEKEAYLSSLLAAYNGGPAVAGVDRPLGLYYALKYSVRYNKASNEYYLGSSVAEDFETSDGHKHKATPAAYGMIGLIYKPLNQLTVSAFGNFIGKRQYTTLFGTRDLDPVFSLNMKVGYKPADILELFFNAHNLLNTKNQEFIYTDKICGIYTVGINFNF